ncbi:MAG TPA: hypothetical protein VEB63_11475 [Chitinophagaceae bacterium]|nr:hypothetical protein [Chitinophagaceae bacterium]
MPGKSLFKALIGAGIFLLTANFRAAGQENATAPRLKVFMDCQTGCDMTFIRTEINVVDFLLDRLAADVHILITDQNTGSGGDRYQLVFFGQNRFRHLRDTIYFNNAADNTDFEERELLVRYLKLGLAPFVARTGMAEKVTIGMKVDKPAGETGDKPVAPQKDPWNYWVFRTGFFGNINAEESVFESSYFGDISASRITDEIKIGVNLNGGKNKASFEYEDTAGRPQKSIIRNDNYNFAHFHIRSINDHWSWGYEASLSRNTRSNNRRRSMLRAGLEYNIFPYKQVNTKFFTIGYVLDLRHNVYFDSTLYDKTREVLGGHAIETRMSFNQKWGRVELELDYHNYFHRWKFLNLQANLELEVRITGGLSFNIFTYAELIRDQIYLSKEGASIEEILTRRRELASGYRFGMHFGLNYRFGSKLNNFVNPRFD